MQVSENHEKCFYTMPHPSPWGKSPPRGWRRMGRVVLYHLRVALPYTLYLLLNSENSQAKILPGGEMAVQEFTASNNIMLFLRTGMWVSPPHFIPTFTLYFPWIENEYVQWIKKYPKLLMEKDLERVQRIDRLALGTVQGGKPLPVICQLLL